MLDPSFAPSGRLDIPRAETRAACPLKITHFNTFDIGGAAIAAARLHRALEAAGQESTLHLMQARGGTPVATAGQSRFAQAASMLRPHLERLPVDLRFPRRQGKFSIAWLPNPLLRRVAESGMADVLHLHWTGDGFIDIGGLRGIGRPIVWTLHDMWAFTGGCFYDAGCGRFATGCGRCPIIQSEADADPSSRVILRKLAAWKDADLTIVTPSRWMADEARRSVVFRDRRIEVIPNCVEMSVFKPVDPALARGLFNLPAGRRLILFGAVKPRSEPRKGYALLEQALSHLAKGRHAQETDIVIFGEGSRKTWQHAGFTWHSLGTLRDEVALSLAYNAADVFVAPSLQDNLPNTVLEALACGTPGAAFAIGGMSDLITHQGNGWLAREQAADDLAAGIEWILDDATGDRRLRTAARASAVERFSPERISARHLQLYRELTNRE